MKLLKGLRSQLENRIHALEPRAVLPNELFPWHTELEAAASHIRREAEQILPKLDRVVNFDQVLPSQRALYQGELWKSYFLVARGEPIPLHAEQCPATLQALNSVPNLINAFFSILKPGTVIPPHRGPYAGLMRYHLGLIVPTGDVRIRVDQTICQWQEGKSLFFDDSFEHEVWNRTSETRVILFVDFARPLPGILGHLNQAMLEVFKLTPAAREAHQFVLNHQVK